MEFRVGSLADLISGKKSPKESKIFKKGENNVSVKFESLQTPKEKTPKKKHNKNFSPKHNKQIGSNVNVQSLQTPHKENTLKRKHNKNFSPLYKQMGNDVKSENELKWPHNEEHVSASPKRKRDKKFSPRYQQMENNVNVKSENELELSHNEEHVSASPKRKRDKKFSPRYQQMENNVNVKSENNLKRSHKEEPVSSEKNKRQRFSNINDDKTKIQGIEDEETRKKRKKMRQGNRVVRTIFVGNVPLNVKKSKIIKCFKPYGEVESVRFRCAPLADPRTPPKVAIIKKEFHAERTSLAAFVRFKHVDSAFKALEKNGSVFEGHHIRVDLESSKQHVHNQRNAIFLGNLPFATEDEDLWNLFRDCGEISSVRIIRDPMTRVGKGFGYINFKSPDAVELALQLNGLEFMKRNIRIKRSQKVSKQDSKFKQEKRLNEDTEDTEDDIPNENIYSRFSSQIKEEDGEDDDEEVPVGADDGENSDAEADKGDDNEDNNVEEEKVESVSYSKPKRKKNSKLAPFQGHKVAKNKKFKKGRKNKSDRMKMAAINKIAPRSSLEFKNKLKSDKTKKIKSDKKKKAAINKIAPRSSPEFKTGWQSDKRIKIKSDRKKKAAINKISAKSSPAFKKGQKSDKSLKFMGKKFRAKEGRT